MPIKKKPTPTFRIRFRGAGLVPEAIPLRQVADAIGAVQRIASGGEVEDSRLHREESAVGLIGVKRGSAVFECVARNPSTALENLRDMGKFLQSPDDRHWERFGYTVRPVHLLSRIAATLNCTIEIDLPDRSTEPLITIQETTYDALAAALLVSGESQLIGRIERVGGATNLKCGLRIPGRVRMLICSVGSREIAQKLGQWLYEEVVVTGTATWLQPSWKIYSFRVHEARRLKKGTLLEGMQALYDAGLSAWDGVDDPASLIKELRP